MLWPISAIRSKNIRPLYFCTNLEKNHIKRLTFTNFMSSINRPFINLLYDLFSHIFHGLLNFSAPNFRPYFFGLLIFRWLSQNPYFCTIRSFKYKRMALFFKYSAILFDRCSPYNLSLLWLCLFSFGLPYRSCRALSNGNLGSKTGFVVRSFFYPKRAL